VSHRVILDTAPGAQSAWLPSGVSSASNGSRAVSAEQQHGRRTVASLRGRGCFTRKDLARGHLVVGAKSVVITARGRGIDVAVDVTMPVMGVNSDESDPRTHLGIAPAQRSSRPTSQAEALPGEEGDT